MMADSLNPIFTKDLLEYHNPKFLLANVPSIANKKEIINQWIKELSSGKLDTLKEEEVKSRFVIDIFGKVLGYKFEHSKSWFLKEEAKTISNGKKSDAALGYFSANKKLDDIRVAIEIKDAKTGLDVKQKRKIKITPVEQAFEYANDMGEKCRWVVVSNFNEIRFYNVNSKDSYQLYNLKDLSNEETLKEFILLFHKDRFISNLKDSQTDKLLIASFKPRSFLKKEKVFHILDQMHHCVMKFDGLGFVDPNYLANISPFNVLKNYVWHYQYGNLFTLNNEIYLLIKEISINGSEITISLDLKQEFIKLGIENPIIKLKEIFTFLKKCRISKIIAIRDYKQDSKRHNGSLEHIFPVPDDEKSILDITLETSETCDCLNCNYRSLNFGRLLDKLKSNAGSVEFYDSEYAYGNYLGAINDYKASFNIYKHLENLKYKEGKGIEYFLTRFNTKYLLNLIKNNYSGEDAEKITENIRYIDLDDVIYNELEYEIDEDVKKYLIQIKEDKLINKVREQIRKTNLEIKRLKKLYDNGGKLHAGSNMVYDLCQNYILLHQHVNKNFIIQNVFTDYKNISKELFSGLITSYNTTEIGLPAFDSFFILDAILHIESSELSEVLSEVEILKIDSESVIDLMELFSNFLKSFYKENTYLLSTSPNELLSKSSISFSLQNTLCKIFTNIFAILLKSDIRKEDFSAIEIPIVFFLETENILYHFNLDPLCSFLEGKGNYFDVQNLEKILKIAVKKDEPRFNTYERLVSSTCKAIQINYPEFKITDITLIRKGMANCDSLSSGRIKLRYYSRLPKISAPELEKLMFNFFDESLDDDFNDNFYYELLIHKIYNYQYKDYFDKYIDEIRKTSGGSIEFHGKEAKVFNFTFSNFTNLVDRLGIKLSLEQTNRFNNLNDFEKWMLNPLDFDYKLFHGYWLKQVSHRTTFLSKVSVISEVKVALEKELKEEFDQNLSNLYVKFFI